MKKSIFTVFIIFVSCFLAGTALGALSDGLVGYWQFDDPTNLGLDSSLYHNDGTPAPGYVSYSTEGKINGAASFIKGSNAGITIPNAPSLNFTGGITIASWVKMAVNDGEGTVISKSDIYNNGVCEPYVLWASFAPYIYHSHMVAFWGGTNQYADDSGVLVPAGVWKHLAVTYDGQQNGDVRFYVDGKLVSSQQSMASGLHTNSSDLHIGASPCPGPEDFYGLLDDVRLYNRVLSDAEIQELGNTLLVPAMNSWGELLFFLILAGASVWKIRRRWQGA